VIYVDEDVGLVDEAVSKRFLDRHHSLVALVLVPRPDPPWFTTGFGDEVVFKRQEGLEGCGTTELGGCVRQSKATPLFRHSP